MIFRARIDKIRKASALAWVWCALLLCALSELASGQVYEKVVSFPNNPGFFLQSSLILGPDGNFYGTASQGGGYNQGSIFKMAPDGTLTVLVNLNPSTGYAPGAALILGSDGNFYGTTSQGGSGGYGTVFKVSTTGAFTVLANFSGTNGANPVSSLVVGFDGNFYGTTQAGGTSFQSSSSTGYGTIFQLTPTGALTTKISFTGTTGANLGSSPDAGLALGLDGNFYGTTATGGTSNLGTVFKVTSGANPSTLSTLLSFTGNTGSFPGATPLAGLILGSDNNFHGTTSAGGSGTYGTVFTVTSTGSLSTQVNFDNTTNGATPVSALYQGSDGKYYGVTNASSNSTIGASTFFSLTPAGVLTTLLTFYNTVYNGVSTSSSVIQGSDGNYYGTDSFAIYKVTPTGSLTTLDSFSSALGQQVSGLSQGADGNLYGTTRYGPTGGGGVGSVFKVTYTGVQSTVALLNGGSEGEFPGSGVILGVDGNFYGVSNSGGLGTNPGEIFKMTPSGTLSPFASFSGTSGGFPVGGLIQDSSGNFYGTAQNGGANNDGTVYKVTPAGTVSPLASFNGTNGQDPQGPLLLASDGNFYGTTQVGGTGSGNLGTIFKMTPGGTITVLANLGFGGPLGYLPTSGLIESKDQTSLYGTTFEGGANSGGTVFKISLADGSITVVASLGGTYENPSSGVVQASDGNLYGVAQDGGSAGIGVVFEVTPAGALSVVYDFANDPIDETPLAPLVVASDGNLYGTTWGHIGALGCVFRVIIAGAPTIYLNASTQTVTTSALSIQANARGSVSSFTLLYGTDGVNFPNSVPLAANLNGFQTTALGTTLSNLTPGTTYYYKFTATNGKGTYTTPVQNFSTLAVPTGTATAATNILPNSAQFNGTVNAFNYPTTVTFQYGTDGQTFPLQTTATQGSPAGTISGNTNMTVSAPVAGLSPGTTYYYRISATNVGGTSVTGAISFTTLLPPVATVTPATFVSSQNAQLNGTVNAKGAATTVTIEYGTDNVNFPTSVGATPGSVNGSTVTPVSVVISNSASTPLVQGTTYYYRVRAVSAGGTSVSPSVSFSLDILSGFARQFPSAPPSAQGIVLVNLSGVSNPGWRFVGEQLWRSSGVPAFGLVTGNYAIEYEPVPGFIQPPSETVSVTSGGAAAVVSETYYPTAANGPTGGLTVQLVPQNLTGTGWRFYGETAWRASGTTASSLPPGNYLVQCEPVANETTPSTASVAIASGSPIIVTLTYTASTPAVGAQPAPLSFATVTNSQTPNLPYAFVGQLRSDVGSATGFVVSERVVATAGHVVFDDGSLAYVTGLQWLFQRSAGTYEPVPQTPQGAYLFDGYATQRTKEGTPGVSSPASQNLDAAALYFFADAGNGGYGGYLASNSASNEFVVSSRLMTLVGYPVDGITASNQGVMFATPATNAAFSQVIGTDTSGDADTNGKPYQVYTTSGIAGVGGNSGGPLCVQFDDGNYYPAAIYLGGNAQTVVRAIDGAVIDLFNRAQVSGAGGANHVGGGVTQANTTITGGSFATSSLLVNFAPGPVASAASWMLGSSTGTARANGFQLNNLSPGNYTLYFSPVSGYIAPASSVVTLTGGQLTTVTVTYEGITGQPQNVTAVASSTAVFSVAASGAPVAYQWQRNGANIANNPPTITGVTTSTFTHTGVATGDAGSYNVMVTWSDGSMSSSSAALNVSSALTAQSITFPAIPNKSYGIAPFALAATASSGLAVSYTVLSGPATVSGSTLTITGTGTVTVQASQSGNASFASAAMVSQSFSVSAATQAITFPAIANQLLSASPFLLNAAASSSLPVKYSLVSGPASIQGSTISITGAGTVTVQASQSGNSNFAAAPNVNQSFQVSATSTVPATDSPTMPQWTLILLAGLLVFFAMRQRHGSSPS